jgi:prepilin-type N-terminal cleavage/methylation domain-containing protein
MKKDNRGFTLVELVVSVALLAVILVPTIGMFTNSFKIQNKSALKTSITRVGQHIIENFKNKNYLEFTVNGVNLADYVVSHEGNLSGVKLLQDEEGDYSYNNLDYNILLEVVSESTSELGNADMPNVNDYSNFDCVVGISASAAFARYKTNDVECVGIGSTFVDPIDGKQYTANYPTIILGNTFTGDKLLIENEYSIIDGGTPKQGIIRIVKAIVRDLNVYIKNKNLSIKKGQEGDGASSAQTRITTYYVGDGSTEDSADEILLDVKMTISSKNDKDIKDTFSFSFPVDKED